jgi:hypothetical protein
MKILKRGGGGSREKGGGGNEIHAPCACDIYKKNLVKMLEILLIYVALMETLSYGETPVFFTLFTLSTYGTVVSNCF